MSQKLLLYLALLVKNKAVCVACHEHSNKLCKVHAKFDLSEEDDDVNYLCILREQEKHGEFSKIFINEKGVQTYPETLKIPYSTVCEQTNNERKKNFGKNKKKSNLESVKQLPANSVIQKFLKVRKVLLQLSKHQLTSKVS